LKNSWACLNNIRGQTGDEANHIRKVQFGMTELQQTENKSVGPAQMSTLKALRGGLVASCQPVDGGPMDRPDIVAAMAQAVVAGGAVGLRIEGVENLLAVRPVVGVPIIGIVKTDASDTPVRITVAVDDAKALISAGADVVAYDATARPRQHSRDQVLRAILDGSTLAMADCASLEDAQYALSGGAQILGTTLSGYTEETATSDIGPDLDLVSAFHALGIFVMAEGRYNTPAQAAQAISAGADCVTVGSALTRLEHVTRWFADAIQGTSV
jgi:N-acylglucosamine-6-phosphate 2-epimerase